MSKRYVKYSCSEISEMFNVCNVRHDCGKFCRNCVYYEKGHYICRDMLEQYNNMSKAQQISIVVKCKDY